MKPIDLRKITTPHPLLKKGGEKDFFSFLKKEGRAVSPPRLGGDKSGDRKSKVIWLGILIAIIVLVASYLIFYSQTQESQAAEWFNQDWHYRQQFDVFNNSTTEDLLDFQVPISTSTLNLATLFTAGKLKTDFIDIRFTDKNGNLLDYWFGTNTSTLNNVYIKIANLSKAATTTVFMYYGNPSADDDRSGEKIFELFDDFSDAAKTISNWTGTGTGFTVTNGNLYHSNTLEPTNSFPTYTINSSANFTGGVIETRMNPTSCGSSYGKSLVARYTDDNNLYIAGLEAWTGNKTHIGRRVGGSWTNLDQDVITCSTGIWYYLKWSLNGVNSSLDVNGVVSSSTDSSFLSGKVGVSVDNKETPTGAYFDYFLVRKFAVSDPTIAATAGTSEEVGGGPVGYWKFDEGSGTTAYDSSSYGNDGTLTNMSTSGTSTVWVDGKVNRALQFKGANDYVNIPYRPTLRNALTVSIWIKRTSGFSQATDIMLLSAPNSWFFYDAWNTGAIRGDVYIDGTRRGIVTVPVPYDNNWYNIVYTYDSATHFAKAYKNGVLYSSLEITGLGNYLIDAATGNLYAMGNNDDGRGVVLDEPKIFNYALSDSQIKTQYNSGKSVVFGADQGNKTQGLIGHWKMDESTTTWDGANDTVFDSSGNGNNGTSYNHAKASTTAQYGNAGDFDGTDDYVSVANSASLNPTSQITLEVWIKPRDITTNTYYEIMRQDSGGNRKLFAFQSNGTQLTLGLYTGGSYWETDFPITASYFTDGKWHHAVYTYDGSYARLYVDGSLNNSQAHSGAIAAETAALIIGSYRGEGEFFNGLIDDVKIYALARTPDQIMQDYLEGPGPVTYYNFDEGKGLVANDISGFGNTGTITAGVGSWQQGKIGRAYNFDGAASSIAIPDSGSLKVGRATWSAWVYPKSFAGYNTVIAKAYTTGFWFGLYQTTGQIQLWAGGAAKQSTGAVPLNKWSHIMATWDGANVRFYINGVLDSTVANAGAMVTNNTLAHIGADYSTGESGALNYFTNGLIDEVKVFNYVLTPWQIAQEYNSGKPIAQWSFDEGNGTTAYNSYATSTGALAGTLTNMSVSGTSTAWTSGKIGKALMFDGSNDNIAVPNNSVLGFGSNDFSISAWVKTNALGTTKGFLGKASALGFGVAGYYMYLGNSGVNWCFAVDDATDHTAACDTRQRVTVGSWYHVVAVWNSSAKNSKLYVNGVLAASSTNASVDSYTNSNSFYIGGVGTANGANNRFNGQVDEVKVYNYALSPAQIKKDYNDGLAVGLGTFDGGQNIQNGLVGYWKMDESTTSWDGAGDTVFDSSGNSYNGASVADAKATTTAKYGNAGYFDGTGDYVNCGETNSQMIFGNRSHTYEVWVNATSLPNAYNYVVSTGNPATGEQSGFGVTSAGKFFLSAYTSPLVTFTSATPTVAVGNWYHLVMVYDGTYANVFINGVFQEKQAIALNVTIGKCRIGAGIANQTPWTGQIDDVKIYNLARTPDQVMQDYLVGPTPIAYYNFDEGKGTTANDISGQGHGGTITPGTGSFQQGKIGKAYNFDGVNSKVDTGSDFIGATGYTTQAISVSGWIYARSYCAATGGYCWIISNGATAMWLRSTTASLRFVSIIGGAEPASGSNSIQLNTWYHIVATRTSAGVTNFYINGILSGTTNQAGNTPIAGTANVIIGNRINSDQAFDGKIDDLKIYNYALTPWQIAQEYNGGKPMGYWKMDDGQGSRVSDYSGNAYHGTLSLSGSPATSSAWQASSNCKLNGCLSFDGTNDYVSIPNLSSMDDYTISMWIYPTGRVDSWRGLLGNQGWVTGNAHFQIDTNNVIQFAVSDNNPLSVYSTTVFNSGNLNKWFHIVATYSKGNKLAKLYVNGINENSATLTTAQSLVLSNLRIGSTYDASRWFQGKLDEVKIFNYVRSPQQVKEDYNLGKSIFFK